MVNTLINNSGVDYHSKEFQTNQRNYHLNLWDTNGQEMTLKILPSNIYKNVAGFFIVCSYDNRESLINAKKWFSFLSNYNKETNQKPIVLLVNKCDLKMERKFNINSIYQICQELNIPYFEVSAKENLNINNSFIKMMEFVDGINSSFRRSICLPSNFNIVKIQNTKGVKKDGCCN